MAAGNTWLFDASATTAGAPSQGAFTVTTVGPVNVHGVNATAFQTSATSSNAAQTNYYTSTGGGVTYYGNNEAEDTVTPYLIPSELLPFPLRTGTISTITATGVPAGTADSGDPIVFNVAQSTSVASTETVSGAAGTFANSVRTVQAVSGTAVDTRTAMSIPLSNTEITWYAPGVGVVKDSQSSSINGAQSDTGDATLRSYTVNGVFHGIGAPFPLFASASSIGNSMPGFGPTSATNGNVVANILQGGSQMLQISSAAGAVIATENLVIPLGVFFDGTNFEVLTLGNAFYSQRVSPQGVMIDSAPGNLVAAVPAGCGGDVTAFARGNGRTLAVLRCSQGVTSLGQLYGLLISPDGTPSPTGLFLIHTNGTTQGDDSWPAVAFDGSNFLVTWNLRTETGLHQIVAERVDPTGALLDSSPVVISDASACQYGPDIAFDGVNYMVVWLDGRHLGACGQLGGDIYGTRVSPAGVLLDGPSNNGGIRLSSNYTGHGYPSAPVVGFTGSEYIVAWSDQVDAGSSFAPLGILGERVSTSGQVLTSAPFNISGPPPVAQTTTRPLVLTSRAFSSHNAYISWAQLFTSGNTNTEVVIAAP